MYFLHILQQSCFQGDFFFFHEVFYLLLQSCVFVEVFADGNTQIRCVVEERFQVIQCILNSVQHFFYTCSCVSFDTTYTGSNRTFGYDLDHTDISGCGYVDTSTELDRRTELNHTYPFSVLFAEESDSSQFFGFFDRNIAVFFQRNVSADLGINQMFYLADFFVCHFLEVREVETQ